MGIFSARNRRSGKSLAVAYRFVLNIADSKVKYHYALVCDAQARGATYQAVKAILTRHDIEYTVGTSHDSVIIHLPQFDKTLRIMTAHDFDKRKAILAKGARYAVG